MQEHPNHLTERDEAEGDEEDQAEDVEFGCLPVDCDLGRLHIDWSVIGEVVVDPVQTIQILVLKERPSYLQWRIELKHWHQDYVERIDHQESKN